jgi:hypothetical protein
MGVFMHFDLFGIQEFILQIDGRPAEQIKSNPHSHAIRIINLLLLDRAIPTNTDFIFDFVQRPTNAQVIDKLLYFAN